LHDGIRSLQEQKSAGEIQGAGELRKAGGKGEEGDEFPELPRLPMSLLPGQDII